MNWLLGFFKLRIGASFFLLKSRFVLIFFARTSVFKKIISHPIAIKALLKRPPFKMASKTAIRCIELLTYAMASHLFVRIVVTLRYAILCYVMSCVT